MRRLKIALVCDWFLPRVGGVEMQLRDLALELSRLGHDVRIITATPGWAATPELKVSLLRVSRIPYYGVGWNRAAVAPLGEIFRRERFDIVHAHNLYGAVGLSACYVADQLGIPNLLSNHAFMGKKELALFTLLDRVCGWSRWPDVITGTSTLVASHTQRVARRSVAVLWNGVHVDAWRSASPAQGPVRIVSVGRLVRRKDPLALIRAVPRILAALPPALVPRFTLIGDGPQRERTEREVKRLGVAASVEILGLQPRHVVKEVLAASHLFALASQKESLCIAAIEASAAGLPVVMMRGSGSGISDVVEHGASGYLAASTEAWIEAIIKLAREPALRAAMAARARVVAERFSWRHLTQQHLDLYALAQAQRAVRRRTVPPEATARTLSEEP